MSGTPFGAIHGIRFRFDGGSLSGMEVGVQRKKFTGWTERLQGNGIDLNSPLGTARLTSPPIGPRSPNPDDQSPPGLETSQSLGNGKRTLEIGQSGTWRMGSSFGEIQGTLKIRFDLENSAEWELAFPEAWESSDPSPDAIALELPDRVEILVRGDSPLEIRPGPSGPRIRAHLSAGVRELSLTVRSKPIFDFGETAVFCRPHQIREAAVISSCLETSAMTPLVIMEPPPMAEQTYEELYAEYYDLTRKTLANTGTALSREEQDERGFDDFLKIFTRRLQLQHKLTAYRSWIKHNASLARIFAAAPPTRAVFLFPARDSDLRASLDDLEDKHGPKRSPAPLLPRSVQPIFILENGAEEPGLTDAPSAVHRYETLDDLPDLAWRELRSPDAAPPGVVEASSRHCRSIIRGLLEAREKRWLLRLRADWPEDADPGPRESSRDDGKSVVLVEDDENATLVLAALYARYTGARLLFTPRPDLTEADAALDAYHHAESERAEAGNYLAAHRDKIFTDAGLSPEICKRVAAIPAVPPPPDGVPEYKRLEFVEAIKRFFKADWEEDARTLIERAVSRQVPDSVIQAVADAPVTVFTCGLPYSFVRRAGADWRNKAIGHIVSDASLIILREIFATGQPRAPITFNLIVDSGHFQTTETDDVVDALTKHFTHSLLLSRQEVSVETLGLFTHSFPIETLFFNTHGTDNAILLGDMPLHGFQLVQHLTLASHPFVFNNSCLSWKGVGQEFIRTGARGYLGTLWSVSATAAAEFARQVMTRLISEGRPLAEAICDTGVVPSTAFAYIYVGTANGRLDQWIEEDLRKEASYFISAISFHLFALGVLANNYDAHTQLYGRGLPERLFGEVQRFKTPLVALPAEGGPEVIQLLIQELDLLTLHPGVFGTDLEEEGRFADECWRRIASSQLSDPDKIEWNLRVRYCLGTLLFRRGKLTECLEQFQICIKEAEAAKLPTAYYHLNAADALKLLSDWKQADRMARNALADFENSQDENGQLGALGVLCQIQKRLGDGREALRLAREGAKLAAKLRNARELPIFKSDEAQAQMILQAYDEAIVAAKEASRLFREQSNEPGDISCLGVIGQCYRRLGDFAKARDYAERGLEHARRVSNQQEEAAFLVDLASLNDHLGDIETAVKQLLAATSLQLGTQRFETVIPFVQETLNICIRHGWWDGAFISTATHLLMFRQNEGTMLAMFQPILRNILSLVHVASLDGPVLSAHLQILLAALQNPADREASSWENFMGNLLIMLIYWVDGTDAIAQEIAAVLDENSEGVFALTAVVEKSFVASRRPASPRIEG